MSTIAEGDVPFPAPASLYGTSCSIDDSAY